jgi:hypothetical protein
MRLLCVSLVVVAALVGAPTPASAQSEFSATLSGANEIPAVATMSFGAAIFDVNLSAGVVGINFELTGVNVTDAFMGHIHCGFATENGPVMVWLAGSPPAPAAIGYDLNGSWVRAKVKESSIVPGSACGNTLLDLIINMANGRTYVNIHTRAHPGGEVRGQIQMVAPYTVP